MTIFCLLKWITSEKGGIESLHSWKYRPGLNTLTFNQESLNPNGETYFLYVVESLDFNFPINAFLLFQQKHVNVQEKHTLAGMLQTLMHLKGMEKLLESSQNSFPKC